MRIKIIFQAPSADKWEMEFPCPRCGLKTPITLGQIRHEDYFICRGCHSTIKAIDQMGSIQQLRNGMNELFK